MYFRVTFTAFAIALAIPAHASDPAFSAIEKKEAAWAHSFALGDIDAVAAMYEQQARFIVPGAPTFKGRAAILSAVSGLKKNTVQLTLKTTEVETIGPDYAVENGIAEIVPVGDAVGKVTRSNYQVVWHRAADGNWLIIRDMVSPL
jgi:uncharacterized protein (TIGR02246 family)